MTRYYLQTKKTTLSYGISDSETTIRLQSLLKLDGTSISSADIGDYMTGTFDPGTSKEEIFSIASSGVTVNADGTVDITGVVRGLREGGTAGYSTGGYSAEHGAGAVVVFSNNPQRYAELVNKYNDNDIFNLTRFLGYAPQTDTDPVNPNDMTRLSYVQALVLGTLTTIDVVVPGIAGETIADGNLMYLNTDNKWYKTDADTASTVNNVLLGIAKGAGTLNNQITNGILLQGVDNAQSGLVAGEVQYASNTAGGISNTPGTTEVTVGVAKSTTELYFAPRFNQQITEDQQDALGGTSGTPSATNKYVTNEDTSSSAVANKVVRYDSNAEIAGISYEIFGDGSDGDVTISSTTTLTTDMNYNNLTISAGQILNTANYRVFVKGTLTNGGTIRCNGVDATTRTGTSAVAAGTMLGGGNGAAPATSKGGSGGSGGGVVFICAKIVAVQGTIESKGGAGNAGADPTGSTGAGGIGGSVVRSLVQTGSGGAGGTCVEQFGGNGGVITTSSKMSRGVVSLLTFMHDGVAQLGGGAGGGGGSERNSSTTSGGGGGGQGGLIVFIYKTMTTSGTTTVTGGTGGSGFGAGGSGVSGGSGLAISIQI